MMKNPVPPNSLPSPAVPSGTKATDSKYNCLQNLHWTHKLSSALAHCRPPLIYLLFHFCGWRLEPGLLAHVPIPAVL